MWDYYLLLKRGHLETNLVDDRTWADLEMEQLFLRWDQSLTPAGSQYLYATLRIYRDPEGLAASTGTLNRLITHKEVAEQLASALDELNGNETAYLAQFLSDAPLEIPKYYRLFYCLSALTLIGTIGLFVHVIFLFPLMGLWLLNLLIHFRHGRGVARHAEALTALVKLLAVSPKIAAILRRSDLPEAATLTQLTQASRPVRAKTQWAIFRPAQANDLVVALYEYLNMLCLFEITCSYWSLIAIQTDRAILAALLEHIARLDAFQGLARTLSAYPMHCGPQPTVAGRLTFVDVYHPLIDRCVPNTLEESSKSLLILGTNMAGKTTFMKTISMNCLLAQTLGVCLARSAKIPPFRIKALIRREDQVTRNQSYFLGEAKELLAILKQAEGTPRPFLLAIDEIFRGTNSLERVAAGSAVLQYLSRRMLVLASTHDQELADLLGDDFDPCHFCETIGNDNLEFDYRLKPGACRSRNAIQLLRIAGYPQEVTNHAESLAHPSLPRAADPNKGEQSQVL